MAAPAISRASGEASPDAPISAAMVSVVAAVGATLVMDAIQSPRSPTDLSRNPGEVITQNLSVLASARVGQAAARPLGDLDGQDGRPTGRGDRPVRSVGDRDGRPGPAYDERVL